MKRKLVSLADLAKVMETTTATVSRALRNDARISRATCERAAKLAAEMGYSPDPETTRLMAHIRSRRERSFRSTLALLTDADNPDELYRDPYTRRVLQGAQIRADELGYGLDPINIREKGMTRSRMEKILQARAIHGALIPPQAHLPEEVIFPENQVALVAATAARTHLHMHRVFPDHFENVLRLLEEITNFGYRRIGLITSVEMEERQRNGPVSAFEWFLRSRNNLRRIPPMIIDSSPLSPRSWFARHQPDVLLGPDTWIIDELGLSEAGSAVPAIVLFGNRREGFAGIDEHPEAIGSAAVDLLTAQVLRRETGFPEHPKNVLIGGTFAPGASLPPAPQEGQTTG